MKKMTDKIEYATDDEIDAAIDNCYPTPLAKISASLHYDLYGYFPFNAQQN
jgi:hypothetical protein